MEKLMCRYGAHLIHFQRARLLLLAVLAVAAIFGAGYSLTRKQFEISGWEKRFVTGLSNDTLSKFLRDITAEPHVAGTPEDFATAKYVFDSFQSSGIPAHYADFDVMLSYPVQRALSLLLPNGSRLDLSLKEKPFKEDPDTNSSKVIPTFLAYVPSGKVVGEAVYANYGQEEDFLTLKKRGVEVRGAVVVARLGRSYRGDIVANAAAAGAVAALVYPDPLDYAANGTEGYYPFSRWLPPSGVQRGSALATSGDPLTPGWPSCPSCERLDVSEVPLPKIPAMPISAQDALPILAALSGDPAPSNWQGGLDLPVYRLGRGPVKLNFSYEGNLTVTSIRNVIGTIKGTEEPDRYVVIGNHRDAWTFGATDPNSGTACLLEVARGFGELLERGWRPKRTIVLCSWDAEEFGLVGSTEWVEQNIDLLIARAVAYLNVDHSVAGPSFEGHATPQLDNLLINITKTVKDPNLRFMTVYDAWKNASGEILRLGGGGSDFSPFLQHAGVPSLQLQYQNGYPVYHSLYDDYNWMKRFGDPMFHRHVAVSAIWGLLTLRLACDEILPFDYSSYATALKADVEVLNKKLEKHSFAKTNTTPLSSAISDLEAAALEVKLEIETLKQEQAFPTRRSINDRLFMAERSFTDPAGLVGDSWHKHLVYGPTRHNRYGSQSFPGVWDALATAVRVNDTPSWKTVQHEIWKVARAITNSARVLRGDLV